MHPNVKHYKPLDTLDPSVKSGDRCTMKDSAHNQPPLPRGVDKTLSEKKILIENQLDLQ